jgi:hypothetical protein
MSATMEGNKEMFLNYFNNNKIGHIESKSFWSYTRKGVTRVKNFLKMTSLEVKTCGESEFDIFEAKNFLFSSSITSLRC